MSKIRPLFNPIFNVSTPDGKDGITIRQLDVPVVLPEIVSLWESNPVGSRTHRSIHGKERGRRSFDVAFDNQQFIDIIRGQVEEMGTSRYNYAGRSININSNQTLLYTEGAGCPVHCDDQDPADDEYGRGTTIFNWANQLVVLLYLSTEGVDFEGGAIYFPNANLKIHAQHGKMVAFPAHYKYKHGVEPITSGTRVLIQTTWRFDL